MSAQARTSRAGPWFLVGVGLVTALAGALFAWLLASSFLRAREIRNWPQVPCTVLVSTIEERQHDPYSSSEYRHQILFGYEYGNERYTSDLPTLRGSKWSSKRELAAASAAEWPPGTQAVCWVSPQSPETAVLKPDSLAPGYSLWFPLLFVVGGFLIVLRALRQAFARS